MPIDDEPFVPPEHRPPIDDPNRRLRLMKAVQCGMTAAILPAADEPVEMSVADWADWARYQARPIPEPDYD